MCCITGGYALIIFEFTEETFCVIPPYVFLMPERAFRIVSLLAS